MALNESIPIVINILWVWMNKCCLVSWDYYKISMLIHENFLWEPKQHAHTHTCSAATHVILAWEVMLPSPFSHPLNVGARATPTHSKTDIWSEDGSKEQWEDWIIMLMSNQKNDQKDDQKKDHKNKIEKMWQHTHKAMCIVYRLMASILQ